MKIRTLLKVTVAAFAVAAAGCSKNTAIAEAKIAAIRQIVNTQLPVGAEEKKIVDVFKQHQWHVNATPQLGLYGTEIFLYKSFLGADYSALITIQVKDGKIATSSVSEQCRFL